MCEYAGSVSGIDRVYIGEAVQSVGKGVVASKCR